MVLGTLSSRVGDLSLSTRTGIRETVDKGEFGHKMAVMELLAVGWVNIW